VGFGAAAAATGTNAAAHTSVHRESRPACGRVRAGYGAAVPFQPVISPVSVSAAATHNMGDLLSGSLPVLVDHSVYGPFWFEMAACAYGFIRVSIRDAPKSFSAQGEVAGT
jgi:hypothetical protein